MRGARHGFVVCVLGTLCGVSAVAFGAPDPAPATGSAAAPDIEMSDATPAAGATPAPTPAPASTNAPSADGDNAAPAAPVKDPVLAKKLLAVADQHAKKGDALARGKRDPKPEYEQAVNAYQKAIEVGDDVNVYFALAETENKLGAVADAVRYYRKVTAASSGAKPEIAKQATTKLDELTTKVGLVTLTITPDGATVSVAGTQLATAPLSEPLVMMPGNYTFALAADGYQPKSVELSIDPGSETIRKIDLDPVPVIVQPVPKTEIADTDVAPPPPKGPAIWPMLVGGVAAVGLAGVATGYGVEALHQHKIFVAADTKPVDRSDAQYNGKLFEHVCDGMFAGAIVVAAATAAYYVWVYRPHARAHAQETAPVGKMGISKVDVAPWVQGGAGGFALGGQF